MLAGFFCNSGALRAAICFTTGLYMQEFLVLLEMDCMVMLSLGSLVFALLLCPFWLVRQKGSD